MNLSGAVVAVQSVHDFLAHHQKPCNCLAFQDMSRSTIYSSFQTCFCCNFEQSVYCVCLIFPFQGFFSSHGAVSGAHSKTEMGRWRELLLLGQQDLSSLLF